MDVQRADVDPAWPGAVAPPAWPAQGDEFLDRLLRALALARRPLAVVGGGLACSRAWSGLRRFLDMTGLPAVNSLMAVDALPSGHPLRVGMLGTYGLRVANLAVGRADLLLVLGSRLDIRQTGSDTAAWRGPRTIFQVDVDSGEIGQRVPVDQALAVDLGVFLERAGESVGRLYPRGWDDWLAEVHGLQEAFPDVAELGGIKGLNPNQVLHDLSRRSGPAAAFVVDVCQNQLWAAQSVELAEGQRFLTSGGMGAMGFALPAAIGAALAARRPVVMVAGDGGFQVNIQELQTVRRLGLPLKMVVLNNRCHGMVRQFQESYFDARHPGTYWGYSPPDFAAVAQAYGIKAGRAADPAGLAAGLEALWADPEAPALLEVEIDTFTNLYPKIAFGRPMTEMEPQARPVEL
jgi:acetolactate synthase-1/2/3 large subunit